MWKYEKIWGNMWKYAKVCIINGYLASLPDGRWQIKVGSSIQDGQHIQDIGAKSNISGKSNPIKVNRPQTICSSF